MEYFDSDVLIHAFVNQDEIRHELSKTLLYNALDSGRFLISTLTIQEVGFVLSRLGFQADDIEQNFQFLINQNPVIIEPDHLRRASMLANSVGYRNINDCIHAAVAEGNHCQDFFTYNESDYKRIGKLSDLHFTILR